MTDGRPGAGESREDQAVAWLVRLNSGEASADDWRALEAWLSADPANMAEMTRVESLWAEIDDHAGALRRGLETAEPGATIIPFTPRRKARPPAARRGWAAAAAALAVVIAGAGLYGLIQAQPVSYRTGPGEVRRIALSDGTQIDLNGRSRLAVRYDRGARRVRMADAEASFDVTHNPTRPFLITAGDQQIRVLGTAFDVVHHDGQVIVTVRRGVVQVARSDARGELTDVAQVPAGFQLVRRNGDSGTVIKAVDPDEAFGWRERRLIYHGQTLASVAGDLDRAFPIPIEVHGAARDLRFSGVLVLDDEDSVVRRLQAFLPVDVDRSQAAIVLKSRP